MFAARLQDSDGLGPHYATIKRIEDKFIELGLEVKPIHQKKKCGVTKEIKNKLVETVAIDDGLIRWNPAKLMPKPFAHLDNAW